MPERRLDPGDIDTLIEESPLLGVLSADVRAYAMMDFAVMDDLVSEGRRASAVSLDEWMASGDAPTPLSDSGGADRRVVSAG